MKSTAAAIAYFRDALTKLDANGDLCLFDCIVEDLTSNCEVCAYQESEVERLTGQLEARSNEAALLRHERDAGLEQIQGLYDELAALKSSDMAENLRRSESLCDRLAKERGELAAKLKASKTPAIPFDDSPSLTEETNSAPQGVEGTAAIQITDESDELEEKFIEELGSAVVVERTSSAVTPRPEDQFGLTPKQGEALVAAWVRFGKISDVQTRCAVHCRGILASTMRGYLRVKGYRVPDPISPSERGRLANAARGKSTEPAAPDLAPIAAGEEDGLGVPFSEPKRIEGAIQGAIGTIRRGLPSGVPIT